MKMRMTWTASALSADPEHTLGSASWQVKLDEGVCIAIPLRFDGPQPNAFGLPQATKVPFQAGDFVGDVQRGGSVNCDVVTLAPHGNGTHTECVGHITKERLSVHECLKDTMTPATLASVALTRRADTEETYPVFGEDDELMITRAALLRALQNFSPSFQRALVIRTLPNPETKQERRYGGQHPPYLSMEAASLLRDTGVVHLLVDIPSVDREEDGGTLPVHHRFWSCEGHATPTEPDALERTITEMIYVPDSLADGLYLLALQIPAFALDAAPSRPFLFPVARIL